MGEFAGTRSTDARGYVERHGFAAAGLCLLARMLPCPLRHACIKARGALMMLFFFPSLFPPADFLVDVSHTRYFVSNVFVSPQNQPLIKRCTLSFHHPCYIMPASSLPMRLSVFDHISHILHCLVIDGNKCWRMGSFRTHLKVVKLHRER